MKTRYNQQPGTESKRLNLKVSAALNQTIAEKKLRCVSNFQVVIGSQVFDETGLLDCLVVPGFPNIKLLFTKSEFHHPW